MASPPPTLYVALYTDEDVYGELAAQIRARGYDAISAYEVNLVGIPDEEQLQYAISQGRAILTHNMRHFEPLHKEFVDSRKDHYGIVVTPQWGIGEIVKLVLQLLEQVDADQMKNHYLHLGQFK